MAVKHGSEGQWNGLPEEADPGDQIPCQTRAPLPPWATSMTALCKCEISRLGKCNISTMFEYPTSQGELIRAARGSRTQAEFAKLLRCDRSCLSRYEREQLGAPPMVINLCLRIVASSMASAEVGSNAYARVLQQARRVVAELEMLEKR